MYMLIDGKKVASDIKSEIADKVATIKKARGKNPSSCCDTCR